MVELTFFLELAERTADREVKLAFPVSIVGIVAWHIIKAPAIVYTQKTEHWKEHPQTKPRASLNAEWIKRFEIRPCISGLRKSKYKNCCLRIQADRITKFHRIT